MCVYGIYGIPLEFPGLLRGSDLLRTSGTFELRRLGLAQWKVVRGLGVWGFQWIVRIRA